MQRTTGSSSPTVLLSALLLQATKPYIVKPHPDAISYCLSPVHPHPEGNEHWCSTEQSTVNHCSSTLKEHFGHVIYHGRRNVLLKHTIPKASLKKFYYMPDIQHNSKQANISDQELRNKIPYQ